VVNDNYNYIIVPNLAKKTGKRQTSIKQASLPPVVKVQN